MFKTKQLEQLWNNIFTKGGEKTLELLISQGITRKSLMKMADKKIYETFMNDDKNPKRVQEDKYYLMRCLVRAIDMAYERSANAPEVRSTLVKTLVGNTILKSSERENKFREQYGRYPPATLAISPGKFCNLKCAGCYAGSSSSTAEKLDWNVFDRLVTEKTDLWGSYYTVISGGEPLLYQSQGKNIIDLAKAHKDNYFLMYTNGTLINKTMAGKMAEAGNITPAISVEGFEKETDDRRGKGVHKKILEAMANLREAGVPYGISITATKNNAEIIMSDEFIDYYFREQGALYGWIFQLMPIGRANSLDLLITPEQRLAMYRKTQSIIRDRQIFLADFWNCGTASDGCISAGKEGGYLYVEWNGNITPCVFNPYAAANIYDIYKNGENLNDVLDKPFFKKIRGWQDDYALKKRPENMGNWILPCPIRDHYSQMRDFIDEEKPQPIDEYAKQALADKDYKKGMNNYDEDLAKIMDPVWDKEYMGKKTSKPIQKNYISKKSSELSEE